MLETPGESAFSEKQTSGELSFWNLDVADRPDEVEAIGVEKVALIDEQDESLPSLVHLDDLIAELFHKILNADQAHRQSDVELGENFAKQPAFTQARRHEDGMV
jgi:hypothetical protein